jgi:hypothetical protein
VDGTGEIWVLENGLPEEPNHHYTLDYKTLGKPDKFTGKESDWNDWSFSFKAYLISTGLLSEDQFERLKSQLDEQYSGPTNAGRPMLLEGGLQWVDMMLNPRDLDYLSARNSAAREIALAFGYPPMLLGIPGDNTYNNQREARLALWEQTILPMVHQLRDGLNNWLLTQGGAAAAGLRLDYDPDGISALSLRREQLWDKLNKATFLSEDEKRQAAGYGHHGKGTAVRGGGSKFWSPVKYSPDQPRGACGQSQWWAVDQR